MSCALISLILCQAAGVICIGLVVLNNFLELVLGCIDILIGFGLLLPYLHLPVFEELVCVHLLNEELQFIFVQDRYFVVGKVLLLFLV